MISEHNLLSLLIYNFQKIIRHHQTQTQVAAALLWQ